MRRREFLRVGLAGLSELRLPELIARRAWAATSGSAGERTALLVVWLQGGASHLETYGPACEPFSVYRDANSPSFSVPGIGLKDAGELGRLRGRMNLGARFDRLRRAVDDRMRSDSFDAARLTLRDRTGSPVPVLPDGRPIPDLVVRPQHATAGGRAHS